MTDTAAELTDRADELRAVADRISAVFGASPTVTMNERLDCDPAEPGRTFRWEYNVRVPATLESAQRLADSVIPALTEDGWTVTNRDSPAEVAAQFSRDGSYLGVHIARSGAGDVVVGGATPCIDVVER
ncbi:hypothetical protein F0L68_01580 [Solihabitans fulvus]|uniref:Lipoprotein n=1 Tax=Solihabitans fulvus TaxID=1892852 RepID=A0A5B2XSQ2_9PSEU|nr:hypothetical protein [Solihabitans fulvus]KAA2266466.1 hypothetical protein F0L68_01580 [Solihabitans fulvus]